MTEKILDIIQKFSGGYIEDREQAEKYLKIFLVGIIVATILSIFINPFSSEKKPDLTGIKKSATQYKYQGKVVR